MNKVLPHQSLIVLDDRTVILVVYSENVHSSGDEIWIPACEKHRLFCSGGKPIRVLEVVNGNWQEEISPNTMMITRETEGNFRIAGISVEAGSSSATWIYSKISGHWH